MTQKIPTKDRSTKPATFFGLRRTGRFIEIMTFADPRFAQTPMCALSFAQSLLIASHNP
jgi:hypothetical protein